MNPFSSLEPHLQFYLATVAVIGLAVLIRVHFWLRKSELQRKRQALGRRLSVAVQTTGPDDEPVTQDGLKERAVASIEQRFTVTKRLVVPLVIVLFLLLMALPFLSLVPAAAVSVIVAVVTVTAGIAGKPIVENAFAGLAISFSKLFRVGDTVKVDDWYGTIEDITITHTTIKVWDGRRYVVPNAQMLQSKFLNYTLHDAFLWARIEFWVAYDSDLDVVREVAIEAASQSPHFAGSEPPRFWVMDMGKEAFQCWVAAWANGPSEGWLLTHDMRTHMIRDFQKRGIRTHAYRHELGGEAHVATPPGGGPTTAHAGGSR